MRRLYQKGNTHFAKSAEKREEFKIRTLFILYLVSAITHTHTHTHVCACTDVPTLICSTLFHHKHMQNSIGEGLRFCWKVYFQGNMIEALRCLVQCDFSDRQRTMHPLLHNLIDCEFPLQNPLVISPTPSPLPPDQYHHLEFQVKTLTFFRTVLPISFISFIQGTPLVFCLELDTVIEDSISVAEWKETLAL